MNVSSSCNTTSVLIIVAAVACYLSIITCFIVGVGVTTTTLILFDERVVVRPNGNNDVNRQLHRNNDSNRSNHQTTVILTNRCNGNDDNDGIDNNCRQRLDNSNNDVDDDDNDNRDDTVFSKQDVMYDVIVIELDSVHNNGSSLISFVNGTSDFQYNFNSPWFPSPTTISSSSSGLGGGGIGQQQHQEHPNQGEGLLVRVVDYERHPEWSDAGAIAVVPVSFIDGQNGTNTNIVVPKLTSSHVTEEMITWLGTTGNTNNSDTSNATATSIWGAVDPRVTYRPYNQMYYVTWDNCTKHCYPQRITYLSTTTNPYNSSLWIFHGSVFPFKYTSGAAILFRDEYNEYDDNDVPPKPNPKPPHLAFVCNSNTADTIYIVESHDDDGIIWKIPNDPTKRQILMKGRKGYWDEHGVAVGSQPEKLRNGDYLLIYNIDTGWPYKPNPLGRCAIGWAILDKDDPTKIVARSNKPLIVATQPWETCQQESNLNKSTTTSKDCNVPMVVFATGLKPLGNDTFYVIYGGADSVVMVSKIKVTINDVTVAAA